MKNIMKKQECQVVSEQKNKKGLIKRPDAYNISIRNALYEQPSVDFSHRKAAEIKACLKSTDKHELRVFNRLLAKSIFNPGIKISRSYFKKALHVSDRTVTRRTNVYEKLDLIRIDQTFNEVNSFTIGPAATNEIIRNTLAPYLPSLRYLVKFSISLLLPFQVQSDFGRLLYKKDLINIGIGNRKNKKKRLEEKLFEAAPIYSYIANRFPNPISLKKDNRMLKSLELTPAGIANLLPYCPSAIEWADEQLANSLARGAVKDPFALLVARCNDWYKERNMRPEWRSMYEAYESQSIRNEDARFSSILIRPSFKSKPQSQSNIEETNPVPTIDKPNSCCYWKTLNETERYEYLYKQLGLRSARIKHFDEQGWPLPISPHYQSKLTCQHP